MTAMKVHIRPDATAVAAIWVAALAAAVLAPDLVTGSEHEHLPVVALTVWLWASFATGFVLMLDRARRATWSSMAPIVVVWVVVAAAVAMGPVLTTGSDPTELPLVAMLVPVFGAIATAFAALVATRD